MIPPAVNKSGADGPLSGVSEKSAASRARSAPEGAGFGPHAGRSLGNADVERIARAVWPKLAGATPRALSRRMGDVRDELDGLAPQTLTRPEREAIRTEALSLFAARALDASDEEAARVVFDAEAAR